MRPEPSKPRTIQPPRYDGVLDVQKGILSVERNDKDGKLSYEQLAEIIPTEVKEVKKNGQI